MAIGEIVDCGHGIASLTPHQAEEVARFTLARDRDLRGADRLFLTESVRVVRRYLRHRFDRWPCRSILVTFEAWSELEPLARARPEPIRVFLARDEWMTEVSGYRLHGGALALGERTYWPPATSTLVERLPPNGRATLLCAAGVVQMDNIGALLRSAACFGTAGVLFDGDCADPLLRKCIRFSMGRVFDVPWAVSRDLPADLAALRSAGFRIAAIEQAATARPLASLEPDGRVALVVGNEARGVPAPVLAACDECLVIPSLGPDEDGEERSLNVAVAASIALYQRAC
ncbi:MAG: RNA methyltransferase [Phycisphaerae bacterium]|jgi:tRNA G18 (ribose-2'-O)-methylase SpoU|nr:RNA methyltransferase [Phycisphaerae bacterium]